MCAFISRPTSRVTSALLSSLPHCYTDSSLTLCTSLHFVSILFLSSTFAPPLIVCPSIDSYSTWFLYTILRKPPFIPCSFRSKFQALVPFLCIFQLPVSLFPFFLFIYLLLFLILFRYINLGIFQDELVLILCCVGFLPTSPVLHKIIPGSPARLPMVCDILPVLLIIISPPLFLHACKPFSLPLSAGVAPNAGYTHSDIIHNLHICI